MNWRSQKPQKQSTGLVEEAGTPIYYVRVPSRPQPSPPQPLQTAGMILGIPAGWMLAHVLVAPAPVWLCAVLSLAAAGLGWWLGSLASRLTRTRLPAS